MVASVKVVTKLADASDAAANAVNASGTDTDATYARVTLLPLPLFTLSGIEFVYIALDLGEAEVSNELIHLHNSNESHDHLSFIALYCVLTIAYCVPLLLL